MARKQGRNRLQQLGLAFIVGLIALAFVLVFGQPSSGPGRVTVARVDGEPIGRDSFEFFREQIERNQRPLIPAGVDDRALDQQLDQLALDTLVRRYVMAQEARALGLAVSDEEIKLEICGQPVFQRDGRCDPELFQLFLGRAGMDERSYTDELRRDLLIRKLTRVVTSPVRVSDAAARDSVRRAQLQVRLRYAAARGDDFAERVEVSPDEAAAFAGSEPERVASAYERRRGEFQKPEQVRARHILFTGEDALERARQAQQRIAAGEDFVVLATQLSEDEATAERGGDLGFFPQGRMLPAFEAAAFSAEERTLVGPVESERGVHLIRVEERRPGIDRSLEEVSVELAADLVRADRARSAARAAAERMSALLADGRPFAEAAAEAGLDLDETGLFRPSQGLVPGIGRIPGLRQAATDLTSEEPHSSQIFGSQDVFYLISLAERQEPEAGALAAALGPHRDRMLAEARGRLLDAWYRERIADLRGAGRVESYPLYPGG